MIQKSRSTSEGKCFMNELFILKWKYCALIINSPISMAGTSTNLGYHIPVMSKVAKEFFVAPTKFRVKSLSPNCLNSLMTL